MPILEVEGLVKSYGSRKVVDGVSFSVDFAEVVGLLGPNGAGKTTSFRMTCGMIEPDQGTVILSDVDVTFPNDTTAIVTYRVKQGVAQRDKNESSMQEMNDTSTWVKTDDRWQCVMHTETPAEAERAAH